MILINLGEHFLATNKTKEGVVTLPSGLQYKVLKVGTGDSHPTGTGFLLLIYQSIPLTI